MFSSLLNPTNQFKIIVKLIGLLLFLNTYYDFTYFIIDCVRSDMVEIHKMLLKGIINIFSNK